MRNRHEKRYEISDCHCDICNRYRIPEKKTRSEKQYGIDRTGRLSGRRISGIGFLNFRLRGSMSIIIFVLGLILTTYGGCNIVVNYKSPASPVLEPIHETD